MAGMAGDGSKAIGMGERWRGQGGGGELKRVAAGARWHRQAGLEAGVVSK